MEIGSFIELQFPKGSEWYSQNHDIARLNSGRAAILHAFRLLGAKRIWLPVYQCESVRNFLIKNGVEIKYYYQDREFNPIDLTPAQDDAVLIVNYFGIMSHQRIERLSDLYPNVIVDNCQALFCTPLEGAMNVYSCRKFVGVPDGAYVIGKGAEREANNYPQGYSSDTSAFLLMRIEYGCEGKSYEARTINEKRIDSEPIMKMSKLTQTILSATDYEHIKVQRQRNFEIAHKLFGSMNQIDPTIYSGSDTVPMIYPLVVEDKSLIPLLQEHKHFQGHWWSYICNEVPQSCFEHWLSEYMVPITIDQRYGEKELNFLADTIKKRR